MHRYATTILVTLLVASCNSTQSAKQEPEIKLVSSSDKLFSSPSAPSVAASLTRQEAANRVKENKQCLEEIIARPEYATLKDKVLFINDPPLSALSNRSKITNDQKSAMDTYETDRTSCNKYMDEWASYFGKFDAGVITALADIREKNRSLRLALYERKLSIGQYLNYLLQTKAEFVNKLAEADARVKSREAQQNNQNRQFAIQQQQIQAQRQAQQQQVQMQQQQIQAQKSAQDDAASQRAWGALTNFGLGLMAASRPAPVAPPTFTYTDCSWVGNSLNCLHH